MSKVVEVALKEVGYTEQPAGTNKTKYGKWFGLDGNPWCAMFVSWCHDKAGVLMPKIGFSKPGFAGCQSAYAYWKKANKIVKDPLPGDIVLYDFNGDGRYDHTGIFRRNLGRTPVGEGFFEAIEGNTAIGNDSNGGAVMIRKRNYKQAIFIRL